MLIDKAHVSWSSHSRCTIIYITAVRHAGALVASGPLRAIHTSSGTVLEEDTCHKDFVTFRDRSQTRKLDITPLQ